MDLDLSSEFWDKFFAEEIEDVSRFWDPSVTMPDGELLSTVLQLEDKFDDIVGLSGLWNAVSMDDHELRAAVENIEAR